MSLFEKIEENSNKIHIETYSFEEYLELAKTDSMVYATSQERLLNAIGEPQILDTKGDEKLARRYAGQRIMVYPAFSEFFGLNGVLYHDIVGFIRRAAQGMEESKKILLLMGEPGSGKSSIGDKLTELMEINPIYVLADENGNYSPIYESPLGLLYGERSTVESEYKIPIRYISRTCSGWAVKRLKEYGGDVTKFKVLRLYPSIREQIAIGRVEAQDKNNADIGALIGQLDLNKLRDFSRTDPDCYSYSGGLCHGNQGIVEMIEMLKNPKDVLYPLLEATQSKRYNAKEPIGTLPFEGFIFAHTNADDLNKVVADKGNEAILSRTYMVKIPLCTAYDDEAKIIKKLISSASPEIANAPIVLDTIDMLAQFAVSTRIDVPDNSNLYSKVKVYNGDDVSGDNKAKSMLDYKEHASLEEGMYGRQTRDNFTTIAKVFTFNPDEIGADPVTLFKVLEDEITKSGKDAEESTLQINFIEEYLKPKYKENFQKVMQRAYIESYGEYAQAKFDRYFNLADAYNASVDYKDEISGILIDKESIDKELSIIEKAANITNPKDFRGEIVTYVLRQKANGVKVKWDSYPKLGEVIEKINFKKIEDILPIMLFDTKSNVEDEKEHEKLVKSMENMGYTIKQLQRLVTWYYQERHK